MAHIVSIVVDFASNHAGWAYALAFMVAGFESFPVLGAVIPGTATIVALGAIVPEGELSIWPLAVATTAGARQSENQSLLSRPLFHFLKSRSDLVSHGFRFRLKTNKHVTSLPAHPYQFV